MKKKIRKELIEWGVFLGIIGFLYVTGLHTEVAGYAQRVILATGIIQPSVEEVQESTVSSYDFKIRSLKTGNIHNFSEFKGKLVFMNFWATWCAPCRAEMPSIQDLYSDYEEKDMVFMLISSESETEKIKNFIQRKEYSFPVYQLLSPLPSELSYQSIPTTFVIDGNGIIISKNTGMANYDTQKFKNFLNSHL